MMLRTVCKTPKFSDTQNFAVIHIKIQIKRPFNLKGCKWNRNKVHFGINEGLTKGCVKAWQLSRTLPEVRPHPV